MLVAPVVSTLGGSWPPVAPAVSVLVVAHRPSVAPAVSTPDYAARRGSASQAVSNRSGSQAFSRAKGQFRLQKRPGTCPRCVMHGSIRVGRAEPPFLQVDGFAAYVCRASCRVVVTGGDISPAHSVKGSFTCVGKIVLAHPPQFWERLLENGGGSSVLNALEIDLMLLAPPSQFWERLL